MPKYRVLVKSYIGNSIREAGEVVEYDGKTSKNLELMREAAAEQKLTKKEAEAEAKAAAKAEAKA